MNFLEYVNGTHSNSIKFQILRANKKDRKILMKLNALRANKTPRLRLIVFLITKTLLLHNPNILIEVVDF